MTTLRTTIIAGLLLLVAGVLRAELPPDAQSAMEKGVLAAQQQDFALAAKFFAEARESAPEAPELLYNLGLAESKIPGRELRAIAWFGAYLAANPTAANAAAVKKQMDALEVKNQVSTTKFIKAVVDAAKLVPGDRRVAPLLYWSPDLYDGGSLHFAVLLLARNGNSADALKVAEDLKDAYFRSRAQGAVGLILAAAGDMAGARKCFDLAVRTAKKGGNGGYAIQQLAQDQARAGEIPAAFETIDYLTEDWRTCRAKCAIAEAMVNNADIPTAMPLLAVVEQTAINIKDVDALSGTYEVLGQAYARAGDLGAARKAAEKAGELKSRTLSYIAGAKEIKDGWSSLAKSGDYAGALKAARKFSYDTDKLTAKSSIAGMQANSGDFTGALYTVLWEMRRSWESNRARGNVLRIQSHRQSPCSVQDWTTLSTKFLNSPIFTEFSSSLARMPQGDALGAFYYLRENAEQVLDLREVVTQMMKQQAAKGPKL